MVEMIIVALIDRSVGGIRPLGRYTPNEAVVDEDEITEAETLSDLLRMRWKPISTEVTGRSMIVVLTRPWTEQSSAGDVGNAWGT